MKLAYSFVAQPEQRTGIAEPDALVVDEDAYRLPGCRRRCILVVGCVTTGVERPADGGSNRGRADRQARSSPLAAGGPAARTRSSRRLDVVVVLSPATVTSQPSP